MGFEQRLIARARAMHFGPGDLLIVAFSGGRDSLALAAGLRWVRQALGIDLLLVHVDHRLRAGSDEEAKQAEALARRLGLEFEAIAVPSPPTEIHPHVGVEEAARRERYRLLFSLAGETGARAVATAHHQQDQAETVLLHLLRGSGVRGAASMREWTADFMVGGAADDISPERWSGRKARGDANCSPRPSLWRPLLREPRAEIDAYVDWIGLPWIDDPTNTDVRFRRNVVRQEILPMFEAAFPGAGAALARYAELAAAEDEVLARLAEAAMVGQVDPGGRLRAACLDPLEVGMQRRVMRRWLEGVTDSRDFTAERIDAVLDLYRAGRGNRPVEVGQRWTVQLEQGMLSARREATESEGRRP